MKRARKICTKEHEHVASSMVPFKNKLCTHETI